MVKLALVLSHANTLWLLIKKKLLNNFRNSKVAKIDRKLSIN